jgi:hypothetical protein
MAESSLQGLYTQQALAACEKALRTLLTKIGPWGGRIFLIGGMTPRYLIGNAPSDMKEHVGTTDLDVVVGVTISTEEREVYRTLQNNLKDAGFVPAVDPETRQEQSFRWSRDVDGVRVMLEFFCPVGEGQPGTMLRNPGDQVGSKISAIRMTGAELVALDHFTVRLKGDTLDDGGIQEGVDVHIANLLPFLVLKAFAIEERDKDKDSYDVVWTLNAYPGGVGGAVRAISESPVLAHRDVATAVELLRKNFLSIDHRGPSQYARFERTDNTEEERLILRRFAHGTLLEFFLHWDRIAREPSRN